MSEKEKSKSKTPMKDLLNELGIKRLPLDNHWYNWYREGEIIQFISRISSEDEKGEDENE